MILLIDNYDSFVHNLARYLRLLGQPTHVVRNDRIRIADIASWQPQAIVLSPGPCTPDTAGISVEVVQHFGNAIPLLGVCLGHQVIVQAYGGRVIRTDRPRHGMASAIYHDGRHELKELPTPFSAGRYHSLIAEREGLPTCLQVSAWTRDQTIMAVRHRESRVIGWQFHPESILTPDGLALLRGFLRFANIRAERHRRFEDELITDRNAEATDHARPITF